MKCDCCDRDDDDVRIHDRLFALCPGCFDVPNQASEEVQKLKASLDAMHRRAQKAEGLVARLPRVEEGHLRELERLAAVLGLAIPSDVDPAEAIEMDVRRLLSTEKRWVQACEIAREHCPVDAGQSHIREGIPQLAARAATLAREREAAIAAAVERAVAEERAAIERRVLALNIYDDVDGIAVVQLLSVVDAICPRPPPAKALAPEVDEEYPTEEELLARLGQYPEFSMEFLAQRADGAEVDLRGSVETPISVLRRVHGVVCELYRRGTLDADRSGLEMDLSAALAAADDWLRDETEVQGG